MHHRILAGHFKIDQLYRTGGVHRSAIREAGDMVPPQRLIARYAEDHPDISPRIFLASPLIGDAPPIHQDAGWTLTRPEQVPEFVAEMSARGVT